MLSRLLFAAAVAVTDTLRKALLGSAAVAVVVALAVAVAVAFADAVAVTVAVALVTGHFAAQAGWGLFSLFFYQTLIIYRL